MDFEITPWQQGWYGGWIDLKGDASQEALDAAMESLLTNFENVKMFVRGQRYYLSASERLWMHSPGKSLGWKAPAKPLKEVPNA